jgi:superfamily II DNA or RNA helicase
MPVLVPDLGVRATTMMNRAIGRQCVCVSRLVTDLAACAPRTELLVRAVARLVSQGRRVLVITQRRAHCLELSASLSALGVDCAAMLGGASNSDDAAPRQAIVGTAGVVQEGFDVPWLDTLVFATPQVSVIQAIGRILRRHNEFPPLVVDPVDSALGTCVAQYRKRKTQYLAGGHAVLPETALQTS